jgi:cell division septum initiation protein DivIVA
MSLTKDKEMKTLQEILEKHFDGCISVSPRKIEDAAQEAIKEAFDQSSKTIYDLKKEIEQLKETISKYDSVQGNAIKAAHPIVMEACEKWSNGEDCYQSALELIESAMKKSN